MTLGRGGWDCRRSCRGSPSRLCRSSVQCPGAGFLPRTSGSHARFCARVQGMDPTLRACTGVLDSVSRGRALLAFQGETGPDEPSSRRSAPGVACERPGCVFVVGRPHSRTRTHTIPLLSVQRPLSPPGSDHHPGAGPHPG